MAEVKALLDQIDQVKAENAQLEGEIADKKYAKERKAALADIEPMTVLVTGATGYIGSHAVRDLLNAGHKVVGVDNFSSSMRSALPIVESLPGAADRFVFKECSTGDSATICTLVKEHSIDAVIHFAAFANLRESLSSPAEVCKYYANNTAQVVGLLQGIEDAGGVKKFVFSSTCCTYGDVPGDQMPITEATTTAGASGAYGKSKLAVEMMLHDYHAACTKINRPMGLAVLRYFNVAGCDRGGVLGEAREKQIRIIPIILEAALGKRDGVSIFGTDHPTRDGTAIRDYIHVDDLSDAHVHVMQSMNNADKVLFNLGIGQGMSVRGLITAAKRVTGVDFKVTEADGVPGEASEVYCDPSKVLRETGWKAQITDIDEIIRSAWVFMQKHPNGYE